MRGSPRSGSRRSPPPFTAEHRTHLSAAREGHTVSAETRAKISAANAGKTLSAEHRAHLSAAACGQTRRPFTEATKARMSAAKRGIPKSPEHRAALRAANLGKLQSAATVAKRAAALRGKRHTLEARAKMSVIAIRKMENGRQVIPKSRRYTKLAQVLHRYLASRGFTVEPEVRFGRFTVDLYDREHHIAHEADGTYWHTKNEVRRPGYHASRDAYLRERHGLPVMRYSDTEIRYLVTG